MAGVNPYEPPGLAPGSDPIPAKGLRVKLFTKMNPRNKVEPVNTEYEAEINDWLAMHPNIVIRHIQQSAGAGSMGPYLFCISIWYEVA